MVLRREAERMERSSLSGLLAVMSYFTSEMAMVVVAVIVRGCISGTV